MIYVKLKKDVLFEFLKVNKFKLDKKLHQELFLYIQKESNINIVLNDKLTNLIKTSYRSMRLSWKRSFNRKSPAEKDYFLNHKLQKLIQFPIEPVTFMDYEVLTKPTACLNCEDYTLTEDISKLKIF